MIEQITLRRFADVGKFTKGTNKKLTMMYQWYTPIMIDSSTGTDVKGITKTEEEKWLPNVLSCVPTSPQWSDEVKRFWSETMRIKVPVDGVVFNIALTDDGDPVNTLDYIRYKTLWKLAQHTESSIAKTLDDAEGNKRKKMFYFYDPEGESKSQNSTIKLKVMADGRLKDLWDNGKVLKLVLKSFEVPGVDRFNKEEIQNRAFQLKEKDPKKFIEVTQYSDKNLLYRGLIQSLVDNGYIRVINRSYYFAETESDRDTIFLGSGLTETVMFLENPKNHKILFTMSRLYNAMPMADTFDLTNEPEVKKEVVETSEETTTVVNETKSAKAKK